MVTDYMRQTNAQFEALNRDYAAAVKAKAVPEGIVKNWVAFRRSWEAFFQAGSSAWGGTKDRAEDYREQLADWRAQLSRSYKPLSPPPHIKPKTSFSPGTWFQGAGVGVVIAVGLLVYLVSKTGRRPA